MFQVQATDQDAGVNGVITYSLASVSSNGASKFSVHPASGSVRVIGNVVRNTLYTLLIQATDNAAVDQQKSSQTAVLVNVTRTGNEGPSIPATNYNIYVSEGVPIDTSVFAVPVSI